MWKLPAQAISEWTQCIASNGRTAVPSFLSLLPAVYLPSLSPPPCLSTFCYLLLPISPSLLPPLVLPAAPDGVYAYQWALNMSSGICPIGVPWGTS